MIGALGLFIGLCYLPTWLRFLLLQIPHNGSGSFTLAVCLTLIGIAKLWQQRHSLAAIHPPEVDRWLGYGLITVGILLFPLYRFALWSQALLWLLILSGLAISRWGIPFFYQWPGISWAFALSVYPNPGHIAGFLWRTLLPTQILESAMAWVTATVLRAIGQPVTISGSLILFPHHNVEVGWGCNGFDMALAMIGVSLLFGFYLRFSSYRTFQLIWLGVTLAFFVNIPRLVVMTLAAVYWSKDAFDFWHGPLGGQIFVAGLLGGYYHMVLRLSDR